MGLRENVWNHGWWEIILKEWVLDIGWNTKLNNQLKTKHKLRSNQIRVVCCIKSIWTNWYNEMSSGFGSRCSTDQTQLIGQGCWDDIFQPPNWFLPRSWNWPIITEAPVVQPTWNGTWNLYKIEWHPKLKRPQPFFFKWEVISHTFVCSFFLRFDFFHTFKWNGYLALFVVGVEVLTLLMGSTSNYPPEGPVLRWPIPYRFLGDFPIPNHKV